MVLFLFAVIEVADLHRVIPKRDEGMALSLDVVLRGGERVDPYVGEDVNNYLTLFGKREPLCSLGLWLEEPSLENHVPRSSAERFVRAAGGSDGAPTGRALAPSGAAKG